MIYAMLIRDRLTTPTQRGMGLSSAAHVLGAKLVSTCMHGHIHTLI